MNFYVLPSSLSEQPPCHDALFDDDYPQNHCDDDTSDTYDRKSCQITVPAQCSQ